MQTGGRSDGDKGHPVRYDIKQLKRTRNQKHAHRLLVTTAEVGSKLDSLLVQCFPPFAQRPCLFPTLQHHSTYQERAQRAEHDDANEKRADYGRLFF